MMLSIEPALTFGISLQSLLITDALSRAVTAREGRALTRPKAAASIAPALDSIPTCKIKAVGGQDGLRQASTPLFRKSWPQPSRMNALGQYCSQLEQERQGRCGGEAARPQALARTAASAATPYTDRGVEFKESHG